jgi:hypothetical protein
MPIPRKISIKRLDTGSRPIGRRLILQAGWPRSHGFRLVEPASYLPGVFVQHRWREVVIGSQRIKRKGDAWSGQGPDRRMLELSYKPLRPDLLRRVNLIKSLDFADWHPDACEGRHQVAHGMVLELAS